MLVQALHTHRASGIRALVNDEGGIDVFVVQIQMHGLSTAVGFAAGNGGDWSRLAMRRNHDDSRSGNNSFFGFRTARSIARLTLTWLATRGFNKMDMVHHIHKGIC